MNKAPDDPIEAAVVLGAAFQHHYVSYAIGGALAYGYWGIPRATLDVDVNVFVERRGLERVVAALRSLGIDIELERALNDSDGEGLIVVPFGEFRLDIFTPSIDFAWTAERTRQRVTIDGHRLWLLSADSIAVFKLLFYRAKDRVDLQRLVAVRPKALDPANVRRHIVAMMGEDDDRVAFWDGLTSAI